MSSNSIQLETLQENINDIMTRNKEENWHYFGRIKTKESFALKIETGRFDPTINLEDFFACTIVVENSRSIKKAVNFIEQYFIIKEKKT